MATFKCKMCGGALKVKAGDSVVTCEYCGTQQTLPRLNEEASSSQTKFFETENEQTVGYVKSSKRNKRTALLVVAVICVAIAAGFAWKSVIVPMQQYNAAVSLMDEGNYEEAIAAFEAMNGYKDSTAKVEECTTAISDREYNNAIALLNVGNIIEAYDTLVALDGYRDSAEKAESIYDRYKVEKSKEVLRTAKVGDYVFFGAYEQDNNLSNGKEDVEWLVLDEKDGKVLVISKYALDCQRYNVQKKHVTWETCTLRTWLNNEFFDATFTDEEKELIPTVAITADGFPGVRTDQGKDTQDKVFLLSAAEAIKHFPYDDVRQCEPTQYAIGHGAYPENSCCMWRLRTLGNGRAGVLIVGRLGDIMVSIGGSPVDNDFCAVRPAMWIDLNN